MRTLVPLSLSSYFRAFLGQGKALFVALLFVICWVANRYGFYLVACFLWLPMGFAVFTLNQYGWRALAPLFAALAVLFRYSSDMDWSIAFLRAMTDGTAAIICWLTLQALQVPFARLKARDTLMLALGSLPGCLLGAVAGLYLSYLWYGLPISQFIPLIPVWTLGFLTGVIFIVPLAALLEVEARPKGINQCLELAGLTLVVLLSSLYAFHESLAISFFAFPLLIWLAFHFGQAGSSIALLAIALVIDTASLAPSRTLQTMEQLNVANIPLWVQMALVSLSMTTLLLGTILEAESARRVVEASSRAKSQFVAYLSHELRTPLAAIIGFSDLARSQDCADEEIKNYVNIIWRNSQILFHLIDDILDFSKIEAGSFQITPIETNLDAIQDDLQAAFSLRAEQKGLQFFISRDPHVPPSLLLDGVRFRQVLINLIGNAIRFTQRGQVDLRISARNFSGDSNEFEVTATVTDSGPGISEFKRQRLFEPFVHEPAAGEEYKGTGLGLVLSRKVAQAMGGDLRLLWSEENHGSIFLFAAKAQKIPLALASARSLRQVPQNLLGLRILCVDDSPDSRLLVKAYLRGCGVNVTEAASGFEALDKVQQTRFDAVILDKQMPEMSGIEVAQRLRSQGYGGPLIALSASSFLADKESCLRSGFAVFLSKPIDRASLIDGVSRALTLPANSI